MESLETTLKKQEKEKYNIKLEQEIIQWIENILDKKITKTENQNDDNNEYVLLYYILKDGIILCEYIYIYLIRNNIYI